MDGLLVLLLVVWVLLAVAVPAALWLAIGGLAVTLVVGFVRGRSVV